ncbi:MAG: hypothetical protein ACRYG8_25600 [Janthinobacterium lividum]
MPTALVAPVAAELRNGDTGDKVSRRKIRNGSTAVNEIWESMPEDRGNRYLFYLKIYGLSVTLTRQIAEDKPISTT